MLSSKIEIKGDVKHQIQVECGWNRDGIRGFMRIKGSFKMKEIFIILR